MEDSNYPRDIAFLEETIGYRFKSGKHITKALTHSSYSNEMRAKGINCECNERMEFLGDSILSYITSRYLFRSFPDFPEGDLSRIRSVTVCEKALHTFALEISLGDYLFLGHGESLNNGRQRSSILADAFEALLAAIFLDGGIEPVEKFLMPFIIKEVNSAAGLGVAQDYKTALQHVVQKEKGDMLEYVTVEESGPQHLRVFTVEARLNGNVIGRGEGHSKREAEQLAAKGALELFGIDTPQ